MSLIKCPECGKQISDTSEKCVHCGFQIGEKKEEKIEREKDLKIKVSKKDAKKYLIGIICAFAVIVIVCLIVFSGKAQKKAIRVNITMNSWYGDIEGILNDFGLEFYSVTSGANCYSGVKKNRFETEKYGVLYTEFTYCKSNKVQRFRLYNLESDQPLRDPKNGEMATYDSLGYKKTDSSNSI